MNSALGIEDDTSAPCFWPRTLITSSEALDSNELPSSLFKDIHTIDLDATMGPEQARCTFWSDMGLKLWPAEEAVQL